MLKKIQNVKLKHFNLFLSSVSVLGKPSQSDNLKIKVFQISEKVLCGKVESTGVHWCIFCYPSFISCFHCYLFEAEPSMHG